jgi:hypothetical protein
MEDFIKENAKHANFFARSFACFAFFFIVVDY